MKNRKRKPYIPPFIFVIAAIIPLAIAGSGAYVLDSYNHFQQGRCTIAAQHIIYQNGSSPGYLPHFDLLLQTIDGRFIATSGYDGPQHNTSINKELAQFYVRDYQVGQSYPCWYNPSQPTQALLQFKGKQDTGQLVSKALSNAFIMYISSLFFTMFIFVFYRVWMLKHRGRVTQGKAIEYEKKGKRERLRVEINTVTGPEQLTFNQFPKDKPSTVQVCYDPRNLSNAYIGDAMTSQSFMLLTIFLGIFSLAFLGILAFTANQLVFRQLM